MESNNSQINNQSPLKKSQVNISSHAKGSGKSTKRISSDIHLFLAQQEDDEFTIKNHLLFPQILMLKKRKQQILYAKLIEQFPYKIYQELPKRKEHQQNNHQTSK